MSAEDRSECPFLQGRSDGVEFKGKTNWCGRSKYAKF